MTLPWVLRVYYCDGCPWFPSETPEHYLDSERYPFMVWLDPLDSAGDCDVGMCP